MHDFITKLKYYIDAFDGEEISPLTDYTQLSDWDSVALLSLVSMVLSEYGVLLTSSEIASAKTCEKLFEIIKSKENK